MTKGGLILVGELLEYVRQEFEKEISKKEPGSYLASESIKRGGDEIMNAYDRVTTRALVKFYNDGKAHKQIAYENREIGGTD